MESFLEAERAQLPPWVVVGFGLGIALWFWLDTPVQWFAVLALSSGVGILGFAMVGGRAERAAGWFALALALGCALIWTRSEWVRAPRLERPVVTSFQATVERVEPLVAKGAVRLTLAPRDPAIPPRVRVSLKARDEPPGLSPGALVQLRARIAPPPQMAMPGGYDFARDAWFKQIGGVGAALGPVTVLAPGKSGGLDRLRDRLGEHIRGRLPGREGGIATALANGDQNAVGEADAEAMRRSGLTHLLSVSGLHIAAVIGAVMLLTLKLLALSERLALRFNLVLVSAGAGAIAGVAYTLLTGAQVPTVRSCVVALLVLLGIALGRDALSMRLLAVAALVILLVKPESLAGASFQLSFAAVGAIIALHSTGWARRTFQRRDEGVAGRFGRSVGGMVATGLAVEIALIPLALYHFHRAGLYGIGANLVAIPLTTFVIMPLEAGALFLDSLGLGAPLWFLAGKAIALLLWIAHSVAGAQGAVAMLARMPTLAFASMALGGLWLALWTTRVRLLGLYPLVLGAAAAAFSPTPDLLVSGDGRHVALVAQDGTPLLLRERTGDFMREVMAESAGFDGDPGALGAAPFATCSTDSCLADIRRGDRSWRIMATRSPHLLDWRQMIAACRQADVVIADRRLPPQCRPRWLKLDRPMLQGMGAAALYLDGVPRIDSVAARLGQHPWATLREKSAMPRVLTGRR
ncbi:ComEC family competence protein [Sphingomonas sinipercae]|uniref:ComEC family competence protein n=1 Tax=Sphingomonas sinipercae TaxID=2714944 RepID=A0A6G7ZMS1_9SPHN|nr:ComEC/Rec2 family competence protein [Sphingomonas sinipercae]QIL02222.1 ComEC family competence protein [Sphingomonas sinipercae]